MYIVKIILACYPACLLPVRIRLYTDRLEKQKDEGFALLIGCTSGMHRKPMCDVPVRNLQQK